MKRNFQENQNNEGPAPYHELLPEEERSRLNSQRALQNAQNYAWKECFVKTNKPAMILDVANDLSVWNIYRYPNRGPYLASIKSLLRKADKLNTILELFQSKGGGILTIQLILCYKVQAP